MEQVDLLMLDSACFQGENYMQHLLGCARVAGGIWGGGGGDLQQCAHVQLDWHVYAFEVQRLCSLNCKPNMIALPLFSRSLLLFLDRGWGGGGGERGADS
jgi:hypothetical protein